MQKKPDGATDSMFMTGPLYIRAFGREIKLRRNESKKEIYEHHLWGTNVPTNSFLDLVYWQNVRTVLELLQGSTDSLSGGQDQRVRPDRSRDQ